MKTNLGIGLSVAIYLCGAVGGTAADFDGDGVADGGRGTYDWVHGPIDSEGVLAPFESVGGEQVIFCEVDYRPVDNGAVIKPPMASAKTAAGPPPPIEGKTLGFFDIEAQKFELTGKVVRVEITGKILGSEPIGGDIVRAMVKDTAERYGQVEFPRAGLEKLGLSKSYAGKPVSLYLLITPQGKEPAAKCTAVGSKFTRSADGGGKYEW